MSEQVNRQHYSMASASALACSGSVHVPALIFLSDVKLQADIIFFLCKLLLVMVSQQQKPKLRF